MRKLWGCAWGLGLVLLLSEAGVAMPEPTILVQQGETASPDETRAAAQQAYDEGWELYRQGTAESLRQAIELCYSPKLWAIEELVVLSACQTGIGDNVKGEGIVGLTRGFMYAGAKRVAVSLWSVNDYATSALMEKFYQQMLDGGLTATAAMREAQLEMMRAGKPAYEWAAFVVQGEWN